jgi:hypothetical protein
MGRNTISDVPRYFEAHVNDCFATAYAAIILHMGFNPNIILADYLSFMYEDSTGYIGTNFMYRFNASVEFTEEELNTSHEFVYLPKTTYYNEQMKFEQANKYKDRININMFINDDSNIAYQRMKEVLDSNKPLCAVVDLFYMPYHKAYQKEHGLHAVVVTGYDEENGTIELFDKYKLSDSDFDGSLTMNEVEMSRISEVPRENPVIGLYKRPIRNLWMEINIAKDFEITDEKLKNKIKDSCSIMLGQKEILGNKCGIERLHAFQNGLLMRKEEEFNEAVIQMFKAYYNVTLKRVSRSRSRFKVFIEEIGLKFFPAAIHSEVVSDLESSAKKWEICANIALKLGIAKKIILVDDMVKHLDTIIELETKIIDHLNKYTNQMVTL